MLLTHDRGHIFDMSGLFEQDLIEKDLPKCVQLLNALTEQVRSGLSDMLMDRRCTSLHWDSCLLLLCF